MQNINERHIKNKSGISLIVLVITIIVMIILAAAVILSLSSSGIIGRANEAVIDSNLAQVRTLAQAIWSEIYLENMEGKNLSYATEVQKRLEDQGIDITKYEIFADSNGVTVELSGIDKTGPDIRILTPESSDETNPTQVTSSSFAVTGEVEDESEIKSLTINGTDATVNEDGSWSHTLTLNANETTTITVVAIDENNNSTTVVKYVCYVRIEPGLYQTGTNYTVMLKSWDILGSEGIITSTGRIVSGKRSQLSGDLVVSNTIQEIAQDSYYLCTSLTGVIIPDSVTTIGYEAFSGCNNLTSVTFVGDSQLTTVGASAFSGCTSLTSLTIPDSVTHIDSAFTNCTSLASVTFGENSQLTTIGISAFEGCANLTKFAIPTGVTDIRSDAFANCTSLTNIAIPDNVTTIGYTAFVGCNNLTSVTFGENSQLATIGDYAFSTCTSLNSINIPTGVTTIGMKAFQYCDSLTSVVIPDSVASIGSYAFIGCTGLTSITFEGTVERWNAITKGDNWNKDVPATEVICSDGTISI